MIRRCVYTNVFEVRSRDDLPLYRNVSQPPRPFIMEPPLGGRIDQGSEFELGLISIGRTVEYAPWMIQALVRAGSIGLGRRKARFRVMRVMDGLDGRVLYEGERFFHEPRVASGADLRQPALDGKCSLRIDTPMRLKVAGAWADSLPFDSLVRHLLRRTALLGAFFCGRMLDTDFPHWIASARRIERLREDLTWTDWQRYSMRQQKRIHLGGLVGRVTYRGPLTPSVPC